MEERQLHRLFIAQRWRLEDGDITRDLDLFCRKEKFLELLELSEARIRKFEESGHVPPDP